MRILPNEDGQALVELAVLLPVFVFLFVGIVDYAFLVEQKIQIQEAATAGAAYATIPGNSTDVAGMIAATRAASPNIGLGLTINAVNIYSCSPGGTPVLANATCPSSAGPLLFAQVTTTITESTVLRYVGIPTSLTMQGFASYEVVP